MDTHICTVHASYANGFVLGADHLIFWGGGWGRLYFHLVRFIFSSGFPSLDLYLNSLKLNQKLLSRNSQFTCPEYLFLHFRARNIGKHSLDCPHRGLRHDNDSSQHDRAIVLHSYQTHSSQSMSTCR